MSLCFLLAVDKMRHLSPDDNQPTYFSRLVSMTFLLPQVIIPHIFSNIRMYAPIRFESITVLCLTKNFSSLHIIYYLNEIDPL